MIAYTPITGPKIWPHVDFINVLIPSLTQITAKLTSPR